MEVLEPLESLLSRQGDDDLSAQRFQTGWSVKDVIAHLCAWQQISSAKLEAALRNTAPDLPGWLAGEDPFLAEEHADEFNARIQKLNRDRPSADVHRAWAEDYEHFMDLGQSIPERQMRDSQRYPWLRGFALSAVIEGSCEHHREHL
jgi:hypothetical protein